MHENVNWRGYFFPSRMTSDLFMPANGWRIAMGAAPLLANSA
jgi:hypothetical protein